MRKNARNKNREIVEEILRECLRGSSTYQMALEHERARKERNKKPNMKPTEEVK